MELAIKPPPAKPSGKASAWNRSGVNDSRWPSVARELARGETLSKDCRETQIKKKPASKSKLSANLPARLPNEGNLMVGSFLEQ